VNLSEVGKHTKSIELASEEWGTKFKRKRILSIKARLPFLRLLQNIEHAHSRAS
jgi:hypothetical protein